MPRRKLTEEQKKEALEAFEKYGSNAKAARALGINISTFTYRINTVHYPTNPVVDEISESSKIRTPDNLEMPSFVGMDEDLSANDILDHLQKSFEKKRNYEKAQEWFHLKINSNEPVGLAIVGDPHLGDNCNIDLLRADVKIMSETDGIMAVNIGDSTDNWGGRLIHLYSESTMSKSTERVLARWFLSEANVPWVLWLHGNHDTMHTEFSTYLKTIGCKQIPMMDWRARFKLIFPACEIRVDAAHNHKGTSIYNPLHGQKRAALWDENADIYVAGHHHNWSLTQEELQDGRVVWMGRARGYKYLDQFATRHGFPNHEYGATVIFVIDPEGTSPTTRIQAFADLKEGASYLKWKREKKR